MYKRDHSIHFVGIGGVGMAGIAEVLRSLDYNVTGSDIKASNLTKHLEELGVKISYQHEECNISSQVGYVVKSSAIKEDNIEIITARTKGIPVVARAEMLAELMRMKYGIAIAGSHGKTTTTSLLGHVLRAAQLDPTVVVGGRVLSSASGAHCGKGDFIVAEADESDGSFCLLKPAIGLVTNIDLEHLDFYSSFGALEEAFLQFISSVPFYGLAIYCGDDPILNKLSQRISRRIVRYGLASGNTITASEIELFPAGTKFKLIVHANEIGCIRLPLAGRHMVQNALGVVAVCLELGLSFELIAKGLESYPGVSRRSELVANIANIIVIDDYAHHPTEIKCTLEALRDSYQPKRLVAIFQPHRYSRTAQLYQDFLGAFAAADSVLVCDIYAAGELEIKDINAKNLAENIKAAHVAYVGDPLLAAEQAVKLAEAGDLIVTLGAGSVTNAAYHCKELLSDKQPQSQSTAKEQWTH